MEYGCCGDMYVFHKLYELCLDPECVGDKCPEMEEDQELAVKTKHAWRKTTHRASKYLFSYKSRKRRDLGDLTPAEGVKLFEEKFNCSHKYLDYRASSQRLPALDCP